MVPGLLSAGSKSSSKRPVTPSSAPPQVVPCRLPPGGSRQGCAIPCATGSDTVMVITDQTEIRQGDCVVVEEVGDTANLRPHGRHRMRSGLRHGGPAIAGQLSSRRLPVPECQAAAGRGIHRGTAGSGQA